jgi:glycosyltransferase involved in cell wall biosynthesis
MLALIGDMSGPTLWRVLQPFTALEKRGYPCAWDTNDAPGIGEVAACYDGVVLARLGWQPEHERVAEAWFAAMRRVGKLVIYEADDDVFSPEIDRRTIALGWADRTSAEQLEAARLLRIWVLGHCDGVTVSTQRLATVIRGFTDRPVVVVPNAIDVAWFRRVLRSQPRQVPGPTIGWAGGKRPDDDLAAMAEAWGRVARRCPTIRFVVGGYVPPIVASNVPEDRLVVVPWLPLERYPAGLRDVDIGCCAVADTPFNRCKSPIKAYEYAVAGAAVVATPTLYGATIKHGVTGYLAETAGEWEAALLELIERTALRSIMARRLLRVVEKRHTLADNLWRWPSAWARIADAARGRLVAV